MTDARFEDASGAPLNLGAMDPDDLQVLSALLQDSVFTVRDISWQKRHRRLALLLNRIRREDGVHAEPPERVRAMLVVENVLGVASQGVPRDDPDMVLSLLSVSFEPGEDGAGHVVFTLAGDGVLRASVEALELRLRDVTRPYVAPSGKAPDHGL
ncbi:MAG: DUF2948 domain-containing protein [Rhodobacteraceae bacterium]|uniref:Putative DUF2948 protein n=1 Tax=Salipiger profundus TaxID=1229727 RepID=A0A1U7D0N0_9RHOB|nr:MULTISPECIES: DUF2948 family protein [Salipiger]APX21636.1 putative DUF2948 protein [Salipiger profundus]MAB08321.1 DUF2948 domain-containing protein [Paracoccaceae bacterium]GGA00977.1 hypothetical protein GCM10011326_10180 [Salipiger profundus]SFC12427.1 Protein of unknown function [Salipiger profundus]